MYTRTNELYHYGVPGMKWKNHVYAKPYVPTGRRRFSNGQSNQASNPQKKASRSSPEHKARVKKAAKIGAAAAGTALAVYGTYKLAKYTQNKRSQAAMNKAKSYIDQNIITKRGQTDFLNGPSQYHFWNKAGTEMTMTGQRNEIGKAIGKQNAKTIATAKQMYKDATNTRFDRGLSKVVNAGDRVSNSAKRVGTSVGNSAIVNSAKRAGTTVKNKVLDVVNPIYEYTPGNTVTKTRNINGLDIVEKTTDYYKKRVRR